MSRMSLTLVLTPPKKGRRFLDLSPTPCVDLFNIHNCARILIYTTISLLSFELLWSSNTETHMLTALLGFESSSCKKNKKQNAYFDVNMQYEMTGPSLGRNALNSSFYWNCGITYLISPCMMSVYSALVLNSQQETWGDKHSLWRCHHGFFFFFWQLQSECLGHSSRLPEGLFDISLSHTETLACRIPLTPRSIRNPLLCANVERLF